jgi:alkaline phosphatase D
MATSTRALLLLPLLLLFLLSRSLSLRADPGAAVSRIAFGSCANQSAPQPVWEAVVGFDPQVFIWLGDNVYGDNKRPFRVFGRERTVGPWRNVPRFYPSTEAELRRRYEMAKAKPGYAKLRERAQVIGTWDDHDYGLNDAGKEFGGKVTSQRLLLDFLDEAEDSSRRQQAGVYASYMFGPEGKRVKALLHCYFTCIKR